MGARRGDVSAMTAAGRAAVAFTLWRVIEELASAAHLVHNIRTFLSRAAHGISEFFTSN